MGGAPVDGLIVPVPDSGGSWLAKAANNRGTIYEAIALDYLVRNGIVDLSRSKGMGVRVDTLLGPLEGDFADVLSSGDRVFDFKAGGAADGNFDPNELLKAEDPLLEGKIAQYVVAFEEGTTPPGPGSIWGQTLESVNARLSTAGKSPIEVMPSGTF